MAGWNLSSWLWHGVTQPLYVPATPAAVRARVYVQELPARFNTAVDIPLRFGSGIAYRASRVLHEFIRNSEARTLRVQDADFIWVPLYTGFVGRRRHVNSASKRMEVDAAIQQLPHWGSRQADHIFVVEMDRGRCFQSDLNVRDRFGSATVLTYEGTRTFGQLYEHDENGAVKGSVRSTSAASVPSTIWSSRRWSASGDTWHRHSLKLSPMPFRPGGHAAFSGCDADCLQVFVATPTNRTGAVPMSAASYCSTRLPQV